jgi:hypothetical protein
MPTSEIPNRGPERDGIEQELKRINSAQELYLYLDSLSIVTEGRNIYLGPTMASFLAEEYKGIVNIASDTQVQTDSPIAKTITEFLKKFPEIHTIRASVARILNINKFL